MSIALKYYTEEKQHLHLPSSGNVGLPNVISLKMDRVSSESASSFISKDSISLRKRSVLYNCFSTYIFEHIVVCGNNIVW